MLNISAIKNINSLILQNCTKDLISVNLRANKILIYVHNSSLRNILNFLSRSIFFKAFTLLDLWVVDYPERENRFEVNYLLVSLKHDLRYIVKTSVSEYKSLYSVTNLFPSANWLEREV